MARKAASESNTAVLDAPEESATDAIRIGDTVIFTGRGGGKAPAIATSNQDGTKLDLTAFPPGLSPMPLRGVDEDEDGKDFTWCRR